MTIKACVWYFTKKKSSEEIWKKKKKKFLSILRWLHNKIRVRLVFLINAKNTKRKNVYLPNQSVNQILTNRKISFFFKETITRGTTRKKDSSSNIRYLGLLLFFFFLSCQETLSYFHNLWYPHVEKRKKENFNFKKDNFSNLISYFVGIEIL